jgi:lysophospholipase L1-like esterase
MKQLAQFVKSAGRLIVVWTFVVAPCLAQTTPPVRIMPLGDSITQGCCGSEGGYRNSLYQLLSALGFNVDFVGNLADFNNPALPDPDHEGRPGATINDLRRNAPVWLAAIEDPDVILLNIGTNDFYNRLEPAVAHERISGLIADLATLRPHAKIIVSSLLPRLDTAEMARIHEEFNLALPAIVSEHAAMGRQVSFVDMHAVVPPEAFSPDGVHPNADGYDLMADAWLAAVRQVITPFGTSDPPEISAVAAGADLEHVTVKFSKPVAETDVVPSNFALNGDVQVLHAGLDASARRSVTLVTETQTPGATYDLAVSGIRDLTPDENMIAPGTVRKFTALSIVDGSFEQNGLQWTVAGNVRIHAPLNPPASDGSMLVVFNDGEREPDGVVSQVVPTIAGQRYHLSLDMGVYAFNRKTQAMAIHISDTSGGQVLLTRTEALQGPGDATGSTLWVGKEFAFTAAGDSTTIAFTDVSPETGSIDLLLDNVRLRGIATHVLTVGSSPSTGLAIKVSPADLNSDADGASGFTRCYDEAAVVALEAPHVAPGGMVFEKWLKNGVDHSMDPGITVVMDANHVMVAQYAANTPPAAVDDAYAGHVETPLRVPAPGLLANDLDDGHSPLTAVLVDGPSNGTLQLNPDGGFIYTPQPAFAGTDSFTYRANDGELASEPAVVVLTIAEVPAGVPVNGSFEFGYPLDFGTLYGWSGSGNRTGLGATATHPATDGGRIAGFNLGNDVFDSVIQQSFETIPGQLYTLEFDCGIYGLAGRKQRLQVTVTGLETLVSAVEEMRAVAGATRWHARGYSFIADTTSATLMFADASGGLLPSESNSADTLLDDVRISPSVPCTLTVASLPVSEVAVTIDQTDLNGQGGGLTDFTRSYGEGTVVTLAAPAMAGDARFEMWRKNDGDFATTRVISVPVAGDDRYTAVYAPNQAPEALADSFATVRGSVLSVPAAGVLANDADLDGDPLAAVLESGPGHGVLVLDANGGFTYTPAPDHPGSDSFTYRSSDGLSVSGITTVSITIHEPGPLINGNFEDGYPANYGFFDGWSATGNALGFLAYPPDFATLPGNGVRFAFFNNGNDDFSGVLFQRIATVPGAAYRLEYDLGITGVSGRVQLLRVMVQGDAQDPLFSIEKPITAVAGPVLWTDRATTSHMFVADGSAVTLVFSDASGILPPDQSTHADMLLDNVRVTMVVPENQAPFAADDSGVVATGGSVEINLMANDTDADDGLDPAGLVLVDDPAGGSLVNHGDGTVTYTHNGVLAGSDSFTYTITDHSGAVSNVARVTITIQLPPPPPPGVLADWLAEKNLPDDPAVDSDQDGISNMIEYIIGGDPSGRNDADLLPTTTLVMEDPDQDSVPSDYLLFEYHRTRRAVDDPTIAISVEWAMDLDAAWMDAAATAGVWIVAEPDPAHEDADRVRVYLPLELGTNGMLFARLCGTPVAGD